MDAKRDLNKCESNAQAPSPSKKSIVRNTILCSWILVSLTSNVVAIWTVQSDLGHGLLEPGYDWDWVNSISVAFVFYTMISVFITHKVDKRCHGYGITDAYRSLHPNDAIVTDPAIISAIMTRQSIHIAISLGLLVVMTQNRLLSPGTSLTLSSLLGNFRLFVAWIVAAGFSMCVMLILVSALCHDYSCRFGWKRETQRDLLRKGLKLDNWSWYTFTVSLILGIALVSPFLCILMNAVYGFLLNYYYFFTRSKARDEIDRKVESEPNS
jgi:hypothetical protein